MRVSIVSKYLAAHFILPFLTSTVFFVLFLLTSQLFRLADVFVTKSSGLTDVLLLFGHIAVSFLPMAIPLSALFASLYTMNKMSEDSEIVAMRSFGLTKWQLFKPFLMLGIFISIAVFSLNRNLIPHSKALFKNTVIRMTSQGMALNLQSGIFFTDVPGVILFAEEVFDNEEIIRFKGRRLHF